MCDIGIYETKFQELSNAIMISHLMEMGGNFSNRTIAEDVNDCLISFLNANPLDHNYNDGELDILLQAYDILLNAKIKYPTDLPGRILKSFILLCQKSSDAGLYVKKYPKYHLLKSLVYDLDSDELYSLQIHCREYLDVKNNCCACGIL